MKRACIVFVLLAVASTDARVADLFNEITNKITDTVAKLPTVHIELAVPTLNETDKQIFEETADLDPDINDNLIESEPSTERNKVDNGVALLLTPFIKEGRTEEARIASKVDPAVFLGIESYSGFLTVNETYNSNLFFWYFPIQGKPVDSSPWIIWLQGGPGASSMTGLFDEIGPLSIVDDKLVLHPNTWHTNHSLLFIENPVGTGFSFTDHEEGYATDMETYSKHLYSALHQFLQVFPELRRAPLSVAGESYAGKYAPSLALEIHNHKNVPGNEINLTGLILGNAYMDPSMIGQMSTLFYYIGMLDKDQVDLVQPMTDSFQRLTNLNKSSEAKAVWLQLIKIVLRFTHLNHGYNFLIDDMQVGSFFKFLCRSDVKRALHTGDIRYAFVNATVNWKLTPDFISSSKPKIETLLNENYKILSYCGQLDEMIPCVMMTQQYRTWKWQYSQEFLGVPRYPYIYNNKLAGYYKSGGNLTEVVIRGAGHMAPIDAPEPVRSLVTKFTHNLPILNKVDVYKHDRMLKYLKASALPTNVVYF